MNNRIKFLRKSLNLTQQEFADKLNIKRGAVSNYEIGRNQPIDAVISLICREFNVNENWLRSGEGEMFLPVEDEVGEVVSKLVDELNPFYDMIIDIMHTFNNLDELFVISRQILLIEWQKGINKTINFYTKDRRILWQ